MKEKITKKYKEQLKEELKVAMENNGLGYFIILQNGKSKWLSFKGLVIKSIVTKEQFSQMEYRVGE